MPARSSPPQASLPFDKTNSIEGVAVPRKRSAADANRESAEIILSDVERHGGAQALAARWARAVLTSTRFPCSS
jgi:hypothetical protein